MCLAEFQFSLQSEDRGRFGGRIAGLVCIGNDRAREYTGYFTQRDNGVCVQSHSGSGGFNYLLIPRAASPGHEQFS